MILIWGDFNNLDIERRVRLNSARSLVDLEALGDQLKDGLLVTVSDGDYQADGHLEFSGGIWRATVDWTTGKDVS